MNVTMNDSKFSTLYPEIAAAFPINNTKGFVFAVVTAENGEVSFEATSSEQHFDYFGINGEWFESP